MISSSFGKITNDYGEIVAEGACEVDNERGSVTMRPIIDMPLLERTKGPMHLYLEDGQELLLTDRVIHFRVNLPGQRPGSVYRLYIARQQGLTARWPGAAGNREPGTAGNREPGTGNQGTANRDAGSGGGPQAYRPEWRRVNAPERDPDDLPPEFRKDGPP
jgi:hypothetical protein